jgi:penicillin-insensitive murein endopeptidase
MIAADPEKYRYFADPTGDAGERMERWSTAVRPAFMTFVVAPAARFAMRRALVVMVGLAVCAACSASGDGTRATSGATPQTAHVVRAAGPVAPPSPVDTTTLTDAEIAERLEHDPESLGALSIGTPNSGALYNAIPMPEDAAWDVVDPKHAYGTRETIESIANAVHQVTTAYPDSTPLYIGQLSAPSGGRLHPHKSHQSGRDADIGYYYAGKRAWYARATAKSLDRPRTWTLVKALARDPNVESIFMDRSVQALLRQYATKEGEDRAWLETLFAKSTRDQAHLIKHWWGHTTHLHVRFKSTEATEAGYRAHGQLLALGRIPVKRYY